MFRLLRVVAALAVVVFSPNLIRAGGLAPTGRGEAGSCRLYPGGLPASQTAIDIPYDLADVRPGADFTRRMSKMSLPSSFDWTSSLPPVRNQGQTPLCWDFSALSAFEGQEIITRKLTPGTVDFSERLIGDYYPNSSGNNNMVASYLINWGAVKESYRPWSETPGTWTSTLPVERRVKAWHYIGNLNTLADVTAIKSAVTQGPVNTAINTAVLYNWYSYWGDYVVPAWVSATPNSVDHYVTIVGWDDDKQQYGVSTKGAWKVRNSWGDDWGLDGYCWIGYGAAAIGSWCSYFPTNCSEAPPSNMKPLVLDKGWKGWTWGWQNWQDAYMMNVFDVPSSSNAQTILQSVELCANSSNLTYEIRIYSKFDGNTPSGLLAGKSGTFSQAGCYSVSMKDKALRVKSYAKLYVWVHMHTSEQNAYLIPRASWGVNLPQRCWYASTETGPWYDLNNDSNQQIVLRATLAAGPNSAESWALYK